jgi:hypothetical protein
MTDILTESFCERCGTRYTFESAAPRKSPSGHVRVLGKGLRKFVLSDVRSMSEALAEARSEEGLAATAHQLDAFHQAFSFCLGCRQYTCAECWNRSEGRCLSCAPPPEPPPSLQLAELLGPAVSPIMAGDPAPARADIAAIVDPDAVLPPAEAVLAAPAPTEPVAPAPVVPPVEPSPAVPPVVSPAVPPVVSPVEASPTADNAALLAAQTRLVLGRFRPGQSLDAEIEAYEAGLAGPGGLSPEPSDPPAQEPAATHGAPAPAVVVSEAARQPAWQLVAPEVPARERDIPDVSTELLVTPATVSEAAFIEPVSPAAALWAASDREVVERTAATGTIAHACHSCGLALSATARFCRRCGTAQG